MPEIKPDIETTANIKVIGVGGSGGSALNRMVSSKIRGVDFIAINTDIQALQQSLARKKLHIGQNTTRGLGAGMDPEVGLRAAEESVNDLKEMLKGADMVFITCGMGGGTGTGAGPKVAEIAKELGILTVAVVTKPFSFEGMERKQIAEAGLERMIECVDTIITIPNDRILQIIDRKTALLDAFEIADDVLRQGVQGISEIITTPGLINVDFADVRAIMLNRGSALMGIGKGQGENRAAEAAKAAIASPLLEVSIDGAKGILFTITGGSNLGMYEVSEAAKVITQSADPHAKVIFGATIDESMKDEIKVTVVATGFDSRTSSQRAKTVLASGTYIPPKPAYVSSPDSSGDRIPFSPRPTTSSISREPSPASNPVPRQPEPALRQPHIQPPQYAPQNEMHTSSPPPVPAIPSKSVEEEELDIPAFIRKKMM
jgi:cell division protein FtsZ